MYSDLNKVFNSSLEQHQLKVRDSFKPNRYTRWLSSLGLHLTHNRLSTLTASTISSSGSTITSSHASRPSDEMVRTSTDNLPLTLDFPPNSTSRPVLASEPTSPVPTDEDDRGAEVAELLWEAQMGFVNHKLELAIDRFTTAARLGSSAACLNLASIYLAELGSQPLPATISGENPAKSSPTNTFFSPVQESVSYPNHDPISTGARWAITGLQSQLDRKPTTRSFSSPTSSSPSELDAPPSPSSIDLNLTFDLISLLLSLYCHGKINPPPDSLSAPTSQPCLWNDGAAIALRFLNHPLFYPTFTGTSSSSPAPILGPSTPPSSLPRITRRQTVSNTNTSSTSRSLSQDIKTTRTIVVQLAFLLALARWPFPNPPPESPDLAPKRPTHWGREQARQLWFVIIGLSELPGGIGTKAGEAIVEKAYQRLNALERPRSPTAVLQPPRPRHLRHLSMVPMMPATQPASVARPVLSPQPPRLHRSITSPSLCLPRLVSVLGRANSTCSVSSPSSPTQFQRVGAPAFFLGRRHRPTLSSTTAVPTITFDTYSTHPNPTQSCLTSLSVEERLQQALVADEEARVMECIDWGVEEIVEEEEEEEGEWGDENRHVVPVGMDPVLKALEAESRLNVEANCAVCKVSCTNSPTCPKCGLVFCSRACRTIACTSGRHAECVSGTRKPSVSDFSSLSSSAVGE
ncbi:hypothetical protein CROQUDRAFT_653900 [Cronartium quercuum f. sp. fusiforme G11]|uniref:Uncharacterized protein n=1 Tax=Cronartium quercuum f. sp. fusiforme G11 TaxID=708437 RepID=A0A9P6NNU5_9BASI|nr:hypothetical protein CROQUDRAFT_653900 [Cronartium quercuum f. sp. fusiforme G11]